MRNGNVVTVDRVVMHAPGLRAWVEMRDQLMTEEVEVDPLVRATILGAAEELAVERARASEIVHGDREMKRRKTRRHDDVQSGYRGGFCCRKYGSSCWPAGGLKYVRM